VPLGTNPWYGRSESDLELSGTWCALRSGVIRAGDPGAEHQQRDEPVACQPAAPAPGPTSDPLSPPGSGTVACSGQQPNPCTYTPSGVASYNPQSGQVWTDGLPGR